MHTLYIHLHSRFATKCNIFKKAFKDRLRTADVLPVVASLPETRVQKTGCSRRLLEGGLFQFSS